MARLATLGLKPLVLSSCFLAASCILQPVGANDIIDFLKQWGDSQGLYDSRRQQWDDRQRDRYQPAPVRPSTGPAVPYRLPVELSLPAQNCGLAPGHYDFDLYGGQRMHLDVTGVGLGAIGPDNTPLLLTEARTMKPHVDVVVQSVRNVPDRNLYKTANDAATELDRTIRDLERSRSADAAQHFADFETGWASFANGLAAYTVGFQLRQHLEAIQRSENRLNSLFGSTGGYWDYDRPRLFGLTRVLAQKAAELEAAFISDPRQWQSKALMRQLRRVHYCADALAEGVVDNANFETIVDEYRIFNDAWHYLLSRSGQLGQYTPSMVAIGREVWEIDAALADVLLIEPPAFSDDQVVLHLAERFHSSARRLEREIELANLRLRERGFSSWGLTQECDRLRRAAEAFETAMSQGRSPADCRTEFNELSNAWRLVTTTANATPRTQLPTGMTDFLASMSRDFQRIESAVSGNYRWRYALRSNR